jgi:hypothetical protein
VHAFAGEHHLSEREREILFGGDTDGDIWTATRASLSDPFGTPTRLDILNRSGRDFPVAISPDNCTLYIASNQDTGLGSTDHYRLYKAKRMVSTQPNVTLTVQIHGTGSVTTSPFNCSNTGASSCTGYTSPDSNGLAIWAEGGTCRITIQ